VKYIQSEINITNSLFMEMGDIILCCLAIMHDFLKFKSLMKKLQQKSKKSDEYSLLFHQNLQTWIQLKVSIRLNYLKNIQTIYSVFLCSRIHLDERINQQGAKAICEHVCSM